MKKKELRKRLEITQEWLDKFQGACAAETIKALQAVQANESLHNEIGRLELQIAELKKAEPKRSWMCPWCNTIVCPSASDLRLHEQECGSNRNRWRPEMPDSEYSALLAELGFAPVKLGERLASFGEAIHAVKTLKHRARPVCIYCGASTTDLEAMRRHVATHGIRTTLP